jgi:antitoxin Phd
VELQKFWLDRLDYAGQTPGVKASWQLQEAKNKLSEVVAQALSSGPQTITRHGRPTVVVVAFEEYCREHPSETLSSILQECPVKEWGVARDKDKGRTVRFG